MMGFDPWKELESTQGAPRTRPDVSNEVLYFHFGQILGSPTRKTFPKTSSVETLKEQSIYSEASTDAWIRKETIQLSSTLNKKESFRPTGEAFSSGVNGYLYSTLKPSSHSQTNTNRQPTASAFKHIRVEEDNFRKQNIFQT